MTKLVPVTDKPGCPSAIFIPNHVEQGINDMLTNLKYSPMTEPVVCQAQMAVDALVQRYNEIGDLGPHGHLVKCRIYPDFSQGVLNAEFELNW